MTVRISRPRLTAGRRALERPRADHTGRPHSSAHGFRALIRRCLRAVGDEDMHWSCRPVWCSRCRFLPGPVAWVCLWMRSVVDRRLALGAVGDPRGRRPVWHRGRTLGRCSRLEARLCVNWRCRRCPRSRAATTCLLRSSTTRLFAPPMACLTRPPTRCARSALPDLDPQGSRQDRHPPAHRRPVRRLPALVRRQPPAARPARRTRDPLPGNHRSRATAGPRRRQAQDRPAAKDTSLLAEFSPSRSVRRSPSPQAGTGHCSGSTWPCGSATPYGVPRSSCTTAPARCTRSATT